MWRPLKRAGQQCSTPPPAVPGKAGYLYVPQILFLSQEIGRENERPRGKNGGLSLSLLFPPPPPPHSRGRHIIFRKRGGGENIPGGKSIFFRRKSVFFCLPQEAFGYLATAEQHPFFPFCCSYALYIAALSVQSYRSHGANALSYANRPTLVQFESETNYSTMKRRA